LSGSKTGGSSKKAPINGWSDPELETIMKLKATATATTTGQGTDRNPPKPNAGAIAGGIVAGVVVVALCLLGAAMLYQRRRRSGSPQGSVDSTVEGDRNFPPP